jgi:hypothetical protein
MGSGMETAVKFNLKLAWEIVKAIVHRPKEAVMPVSKTKVWALFGSITIACLQGVALKWPQYKGVIDVICTIIGTVSGAGVAFGLRNAIANK